MHKRTIFLFCCCHDPLLYGKKFILVPTLLSLLTVSRQWKGLIVQTPTHSRAIKVWKFEPISVDRLFFLVMDFEKDIQFLEPLAISLMKTRDLGEKQELLLQSPRVLTQLSNETIKPFLPSAHDLFAKIALYAVITIGQDQILFSYPGKRPPKKKVSALLASLVAIERFYESIGGIVGYHVHILKLLLKNQAKTLNKDVNAIFARAPGFDLSEQSQEIEKALWMGIRALDEIAEIYPIGGLGSRLNLKSKTHEPLPVACLPFCGRTLLEGLIRDVQAREFLYYRLFHRQITVPIAMMTSLEKHNAARIEGICEKKSWFGRPKESFYLFSQLSVPVVTEEGKWSLKAPLEMHLQPGGHGALWKAAVEKGLFFWLQNQEKQHILIRQINNPIAGLDLGLIALIGIGKKEKKTFGFASCERLPHAAEGLLVLIQEAETLRLSNIEYTDFKRYGIEDLATKDGYSLYPANTNILYANLEKILPVIKKNPLPGLTLNIKNKEPFFCPLTGTKSEMLAGRLESMMQNISDSLTSKKDEPMPTFLTYNERRKTISAAKKSFENDDKLLETPEGAFYDLLHNAYDLLKNRCDAHLLPFCTQEEYLKHGPSLIFLYHPALGPLYSLIAQKIISPRLANGSELQLEIADLFLSQLKLEGSMRILAQNVMGHRSQGILRYSHKTGKCVLKNVRVKNKGILRKATQDYWKNQFKRQEELKIVLQGHSEFYAEDIVFEGAHTIVVPDGQRWIARQTPDRHISYTIEKPSWKWDYTSDNQIIKFIVNL